MGNAVKIVLAAVFGYVLGRRKKFKLAVALGMFFGAKKLKINPREVLSGLKKEVTELPVVDELGVQTREQLLVAAKDAVNTVVTRWAGKLADSLTERTENLTGAATETARPDRDEQGSPSEEAEEAQGAAEEPEEEASTEDEEPEKDEKPRKTRQAGQRRAKSGTTNKSTRSSTGTRTRKSTPRGGARGQGRGDEHE